MMTVPSAVSASSSSWSAPRRSSPSSRPSAAASPWRSVVFLTPAMRSARHSQVVEAARVKRMTPIISAFKSVRRHLIGKFSSPFQRVARPTHVPGFICSCLFLLSRYCTVRNLFTSAARFPKPGSFWASAPSLALIHPSAWNRISANFIFTEFSEVCTAQVQHL
jgi:hypothetical protein